MFVIAPNEQLISNIAARLHTFEKFIRRNQYISSGKKEIYLNFIQFTRKLANQFLHQPISRHIMQEIQQCENLVLKGWLLEKAEELAK